MPDRRMIFVPVFLLAQAWLVHWAAGRERAPAPPSLSSFPSEIGEWRLLREDPIAADVLGELRADQLLSRTYVQSATGSVAGLFVAWFQSQRAGSSQPHSPKVCLPASGWIPEVSGEITLDTAAGAIRVNRYIVVNHGQRDVVLYWYQGPRRVTAGEWEAKLWLMVDALRDKRTDTALVRVVVQATPFRQAKPPVPPAFGTFAVGQAVSPVISEGGDQAAEAIASGFARSVYPVLRENLPQ